MINSKNSIVKYGLLHIFTPLLLSATLYFFFGNTKTAIGILSQYILKSEPIANARLFVQTNLYPPPFIMYQLPDGLWAYAFCAAFLWIWQDRNAALISISAFILCTTYEGMQYLKWTAGTFDYWDVLAMFIGCFYAFLMTRSNFKNT